ncbi:MAG TPA: glycosyltransferase [Actinomycetota bacterium]|nr:glycosyltransferase [Actinomycetota bacterium]
MLRTVPVPDAKQLDDYREPAGDEAVERLLDSANALKGTRVVHVSSTAFGGGVSELLHTQVGLLRNLGIDTDWQVIEGSDDFFTVTKLVHNACQGAPASWNAHLERTYLDRVRENAERFDPHADFVIVHDPQPLALVSMLDGQRQTAKWVWRCHIDLSTPHEDVWAFFAPHVDRYDAVVFTLEDYMRPGLNTRVAIIPPSIDPLSPKNSWLDHDAVWEILLAYGIDPQRPVFTQISRFDPWKDPLGVIDAYRIAKEEVPDLQLVLAGSMAHDDPEGWEFLERTEEHRRGDPDIHILTNLQDVGPVAINAFQRGSTVVTQKSIREGFGLTAAEAMWKDKAVIAGDAGGLRLQVRDGETGFLVRTVEECAEHTVTLVRNAELRERMGRASREHVRRNFLTLREVTDYLDLLASL